MSLKESHQSTNNVLAMKPMTKSSVEVTLAENIPEVIANAFRTAKAPRSGACFISLPQDVLNETTDAPVIMPLKKVSYGATHAQTIEEAANLINHAKFPVLLLGQEASRPANTKAIRELLMKTHLPTVGTFQAAGVAPRDLVSCFAGRVGLFCNQPGNQLLNKADVVITVGLNVVEYDPEIWNAKQDKTILHIDYMPARIHETYQPKLELLGDIDVNIRVLAEQLDQSMQGQNDQHIKPFHDEHQKIIQTGKKSKSKLMHPLHFIHLLRETVDDDTLIICDIGTIYMWMARYFLSYQPHHLLFSNGQQTLGVGLPWAMGARFVYPDKNIISMSGDGGFLFSAMELETAVREKLHFIHFVWRDGSYNMVKEQELMKYKRESGVEFGKVNLIDFAKSFGAKGYELNNPNDFTQIYSVELFDEV